MKKSRIIFTYDNKVLFGRVEVEVVDETIKLLKHVTSEKVAFWFENNDGGYFFLSAELLERGFFELEIWEE